MTNRVLLEVLAQNVYNILDCINSDILTPTLFILYKESLDHIERRK